jgi:hypothetical protein
MHLFHKGASLYFHLVQGLVVAARLTEAADPLGCFFVAAGIGQPLYQLFLFAHPGRTLSEFCFSYVLPESL